MIKIINQLSKNIADMAEKKFYIALAGSFVVILLPILFLLFFTRSHINSWQTRIEDINEKRVAIQTALTRFERVKKEREAVNAKLRKEKSFKILDTFQELTRSLNISRNITSEPRLTSTRQDKDYTEISLSAQFKDLSMQQLTDLLLKISMHELVYLKKLDITKSQGPPPPAINVSLTIATLKSTSEVT